MNESEVVFEEVFVDELCGRLGNARAFVEGFAVGLTLIALLT